MLLLRAVPILSAVILWWMSSLLTVHCHECPVSLIEFTASFQKGDAPRNFSKTTLLQGFWHYYMIEVRSPLDIVCRNALVNLTHVEVLHMTGLNISGVEVGAFAGAPELVTLSLSYNKLRSVKTGQYNTNKNLKSLYLNANQIVYIEQDAFDNMDRLEKLYLDHNEIRAIDSFWFKTCPKLSYINLAVNRITYIPLNAFRNILAHNLSVEYILNNNEIVTISERAIDTRLPGHKQFVLHLDHNIVNELNVDVFENLKNIKRLSLNNNGLTCLNDKILEMIVKTRIELYLHNNPFTCDCLKELERLTTEGLVRNLYFARSSTECKPH